MFGIHPVSSQLMTSLVVELSYERQLETSVASRHHLCVWFSTFKNASNRRTIQLNTLRNWAKFLPGMQPILFTDLPSPYYERPAREDGWLVHDVPASNKQGTPFLHDMVRVLVGSDTPPSPHNATFYGFANGDILFDDSLPATLQAVAAHFSHLPTDRPVMVTGRRTNVKYAVNSSYEPLMDFFVIRELKRKGRLFRSDAEDYFFFTPDFPWSALKPVVVGRPGIDNYLVAMAKRLNVTVIDATGTLTAVHQMAPDEGNEAGSHNADGNFNKKTIGRFKYSDGTTTRLEYETVFDQNRLIIRVKNRKTKRFLV